MLNYKEICAFKLPLLIFSDKKKSNPWQFRQKQPTAISKTERQGLKNLSQGKENTDVYEAFVLVFSAQID